MRPGRDFFPPDEGGTALSTPVVGEGGVVALVVGTGVAAGTIVGGDAGASEGGRSEATGGVVGAA